MPLLLLWLFLPLHLTANLISIIVGFLRGQGAVMLKAKRDALVGLPQMLRKRRVIQRNRTATVREIFDVLNRKIFRNM
jgi:molybdate-binding protein